MSNSTTGMGRLMNTIINTLLQMNYITLQSFSQQQSDFFMLNHFCQSQKLAMLTLVGIAHNAKVTPFRNMNTLSRYNGTQKNRIIVYFYTHHKITSGEASLQGHSWLAQSPVIPLLLQALLPTQGDECISGNNVGKECHSTFVTRTFPVQVLVF